VHMLHEVDLILGTVERDLVIIGEIEGLRKRITSIEAPAKIGTAGRTLLQRDQKCIVPAFRGRLDLCYLVRAAGQRIGDDAGIHPIAATQVGSRYGRASQQPSEYGSLAKIMKAIRR